MYSNEFQVKPSDPINISNIITYWANVPCNIQFINYWKNDTLSDKKGNLTVLKLHELCYYVQCWYIVLNDELIFKDNFQALIHGPTSNKLFKALQPTYTSLYDIIPNTLKLGNIEKLSKYERKHIDNVLERYSCYSGMQLSKISHREHPWLEARGNIGKFDKCTNFISNKTIKEFYTKLYNE